MRWTSKPNIISERKETIEMRIQHNIMAMNAYRNYANNTSAPGGRNLPENNVKESKTSCVFSTILWR